MQHASGTRGVAGIRPARAPAVRAWARAVAGTLILALLASGCGLKGSLTLPEKARNVVIRPAPGTPETQAPPPAPEVEPLPPPELPPDTRGNTRG
jgi:predicted small lipoprotein YifL